MLNADDILGPNTQLPTPRRIYMRAWRRLNTPCKPKNERSATKLDLERGIQHDHLAALAKAAERRKARGDKRNKSFKHCNLFPECSPDCIQVHEVFIPPVPTPPSEPSKFELVWDI